MRDVDGCADSARQAAPCDCEAPRAAGPGARRAPGGGSRRRAGGLRPATGRGGPRDGPCAGLRGTARARSQGLPGRARPLYPGQRAGPGPYPGSAHRPGRGRPRQVGRGAGDLPADHPDGRSARLASGVQAGPRRREEGGRRTRAAPLLGHDQGRGTARSDSHDRRHPVAGARARRATCGRPGRASRPRDVRRATSPSIPDSALPKVRPGA